MKTQNCYVVIKENKLNVKFHGVFSSLPKARQWTSKLAKHYNQKIDNFQIILFEINDTSRHLMSSPYTVPDTRQMLEKWAKEYKPA